LKRGGGTFYFRKYFEKNFFHRVFQKRKKKNFLDDLKVNKKVKKVKIVK
jgi:hypothetical protein